MEILSAIGKDGDWISFYLISSTRDNTPVRENMDYCSKVIGVNSNYLGIKYPSILDNRSIQGGTLEKITTGGKSKSIHVHVHVNGICTCTCVNCELDIYGY